MSSETSRIDMR